MKKPSPAEQYASGRVNKLPETLKRDDIVLELVAAYRAGGAKKTRKPAEPRPAQEPRARDLIWDAVVEVTGSDPVVSGAHIGKIVKLLKAAFPPYTPDEVLRWGELIQKQDWWKGGKPGIGLIEQKIGMIRDSPGVVLPQNLKGIAGWKGNG